MVTGTEPPSLQIRVGTMFNNEVIHVADGKSFDLELKSRCTTKLKDHFQETTKRRQCVVGCLVSGMGHKTESAKSVVML